MSRRVHPRTGKPAITHAQREYNLQKGAIEAASKHLTDLADFFESDKQYLTMAGVPRAVTAGALRYSAQRLDETLEDITAAFNAR